jgi:branched-subunit amino acid aminotransferase/4-amino-4-deoxychorismate lyase
MTVLVNGVVEPDGLISVFDPMVIRGDGCFEAVRSYGGRLFQLRPHLERLANSARALGIPLPAMADLTAWSERVALDGGDCSVRILASSGKPDSHPLVVVLSLPIEPMPESLRLRSVPAPWHPAGAEWELSGIKTLSYAPNMAATRVATADGYDDALLIGRGGEVLELPTSSIAWVVDGVLETPALGLGILASITRRVVLDLCDELGIEVRDGTWSVDRLDEAREVMALSTVREVMPVVAVDDRRYGIGPTTAKLAVAYRDSALAAVSAPST